MEARKVQRVGYSTLTVSLPRDWVEDVKLKAGDIVSIKREDDGSLKLVPGTEHKRDEVRNCIVNADLCNASHLLTRVITANYILGHDTIQIVAKEELKRDHLEEIRATTQRLTGLSIVEQTMKQVTLQSFVDPTRFPIYGLMRRLHIILASMLDVSLKALVERRPELAAEVAHMEEESDRIYWLIVRQLLLAIRDRSVGTKIGIESPVHIAGNRVVAKTLEEMADSAENVAREVIALKDRQINSEVVLVDIAKFGAQTVRVSDQTMKALLTGDIGLANGAVEMVEEAEEDERKLTQKVLTHVKDPASAAGLRIIVWNLGQVTKYCRMIGEVTINRVLEKPSPICEYLPIPEARAA
ncbi:MAG TPA: phosphate uptake regulator PhoU [Candidatus Acidoferrales bacterium]|nr:phosphate uptake regulator PhoU [Candidatus Acidoferrales bacterium]